MSIQVYGIPNCGTCKKAFTWLQSNSIDYEFINVKETPPKSEMIQNWVKSLGAASMRNTSGQSYRALGDEKKTWTDQQWIEAFANDAMLLKRPLFVKEGTAILVEARDIIGLCQVKRDHDTPHPTPNVLIGWENPTAEERGGE